MDWQFYFYRGGGWGGCFFKPGGFFSYAVQSCLFIKFLHSILLHLPPSWIFFPAKFGPGFFFEKSSHPPHKNQMVDPLCQYDSQISKECEFEDKQYPPKVIFCLDLHNVHVSIVETSNWGNGFLTFIIGFWQNVFIKWATSWENLFMPYANNKGADQPAHLHSLISTFVVRCLDSIISLDSISEISRPWLVSSAEQAGLSLNWLRTPKTGFLVTRLKCCTLLS